MLRAIESDTIVLCEEKGVNWTRLTLADCTAIAVQMVSLVKSTGGDRKGVTVCDVTVMVEK